MPIYGIVLICIAYAVTCSIAYPILRHPRGFNLKSYDSAEVFAIFWPLAIVFYIYIRLFHWVIWIPAKALVKFSTKTVNKIFDHSDARAAAKRIPKARIHND